VNNDNANKWDEAVRQRSSDSRTSAELWDSTTELLGLFISSIRNEQGYTDEQKERGRHLVEQVRSLYVDHTQLLSDYNKGLADCAVVRAELYKAQMESERLRARARYDFLQLRRIRKIAGDALSGERPGDNEAPQRRRPGDDE
tara:strand:- start:461 stop:889 length:429 start_codon:yes stop_codon:yes gene_type:complete